MSQSEYPEPVVGAFIFNPEHKLFLIKTHKWRDKYCVPGGHVELGEKIEDALIREAFEETGLRVTKPQFICLWEFINEDSFHEKKHMLFLNYKVMTQDTAVTLNDEAEDYIFVALSDALTLPLETYTKRTIEEYLLT